jgi:hypothetical protein
VNADPATVVRVLDVYLVFLRGRCRYVVMQHVAGDTVANRRLSTGKYIDLAAVAAAVKQLVSIRVPAGTPPGHVGGGVMTFSSKPSRPANTPRSDISRLK